MPNQRGLLVQIHSRWLVNLGQPKKVSESISIPSNLLPQVIPVVGLPKSVQSTISSKWFPEQIPLAALHPAHKPQTTANNLFVPSLGSLLVPLQPMPRNSSSCFQITLYQVSHSSTVTAGCFLLSSWGSALPNPTGPHAAPALLEAYSQSADQRASFISSTSPEFLSLALPGPLC